MPASNSRLNRSQQMPNADKVNKADKADKADKTGAAKANKADKADKTGAPKGHRPHLQVPHLPGLHRAGRATAETKPGAVVIGGGMSGLVAALELAKAGYAVTVLERTGALGGCVGQHEVAGLTLDSGAESFSTRSEAVADLIAELGLAERIQAPNPQGAWIQLPVKGGSLAAGAQPLPRTGILGIPSDPADPAIVRAIGKAGSVRAALDRVRPMGSLLKKDRVSLGEVVRTRMGEQVLRNLVAPVVAGVYSADPDLLDVDSVAPGLRAAMAKHGSLGAAVAAMRAAAPAGSAVAGLAGGMGELTNALAAALRGLGVRLLTEVAVEGVRRGGDGSAAAQEPAPMPGQEPRQGPRQEPAGAVTVVDPTGGLVTAAGTDAAGAGSPAPAGPGPGGSKPAGLRPAGPAPETAAHAQPAPRWLIAAGGREYAADALVVATDGGTAVDLLAPLVPGLAELKPAAGPGVALVTLVVDLPELDSHPRGTGVLVAEETQGVEAKAMTHATAKWQWLADAAGPSNHVLRLSYGRSGAGSGTGPDSRSDGNLYLQALADASALLGVKITDADVVGWDVVRWVGALPFAAVGHQERVAAVRALVAAVPGLQVVGAWLAGTGLVSVVSDTRRHAAALAPAAADGNPAGSPAGSPAGTAEAARTGDLRATAAERPAGGPQASPE
jgi:protoporphyrinogen/coproporphyrinogen III oxidase